MTFADLLEPHTPGVRAIAKKLRLAVLAALPEAEERVLPGWHALAFRHDEAGHICALFPMDDEVKLYLEFGADMRVPAGALLGETKQARHLRFVNAADVKPRSLKPLIVEALLTAARRRALRRAARATRAPRRR